MKRIKAALAWVKALALFAAVAPFVAARDVVRIVLATFDKRDRIAITGLAMLGAGLVFVYWPAALIVDGTIVVAVAVLTGGVEREDVDNN